MGSSTKNNRTVLLVEDSDDDAFFFERALANSGAIAKLVRVVDGGSAIQFLERASHDSLDLRQNLLLFLDLKLPVLSGFDVLKWIRERGLLLEIVVLSGSDLEMDVSAARELGASDYLVKPISATALKARLGNGTSSNA
jgi:DNA-binding response OmpR family regulator